MWQARALVLLCLWLLVLFQEAGSWSRQGKTCRPVCGVQARALVLLCLWLLVLFQEVGVDKIQNTQTSVRCGRALVLLCLWLLVLFQEAGTQSVSANACCAADLSGGDRGEAIAVDDADLELGGSGLRQ